MALTNIPAIEYMPDAVIVADHMMNVIAINTTALLWWGYTREEVLGKNVRILMPERYREEHDRAVVRLQQAEKPRQLGKLRPLEGRRKDGTEFPISITLTMWQEQGETYYVANAREPDQIIEATIAVHKRRWKKILAVFLVSVSLIVAGLAYMAHKNFTATKEQEKEIARLTEAQKVERQLFMDIGESLGALGEKLHGITIEEESDITEVNKQLRELEKAMNELKVRINEATE